ncbi:hypothetical protein M1D88_14200 [Arthrobacter sp. R1-13]
MVIQRSIIFRTLTGFHGGLRRGTAAALLGAVLVFVAGTPASNAVVAAPSAPMESPTVTTDSSDTRLPSDAKGTPAPPSSQEPKGGKPRTVPAESPTAEPAPPAAEPVHPDQDGAVSVSGVTEEAMSSPSPAATGSVYGQATQNPSYGEVQAQGSTTEKQPMEQVANVDQAEASRLLLWGIGLVLLSGIAAVIFLRLRRV